jgi:diguanylate cyclase (GGDEF)-like protein
MRVVGNRRGSGMNGGPWLNRAWVEFEESVSNLAGVFVQAFDRQGRPLSPRRELPPVCALLARSPLGRQACAEDCLRKVARGADGVARPPARCYAGLSYCVVAPGRPGDRLVVFQVGRVLTELFGEEQVADIPGKYRIDRADFVESLRHSRQVAAPDLDRMAQHVLRAARSIGHTTRRLAERRGRIGSLTAQVSRLEGEVRAFHALAEKILGARELDEILTLALETAMLSLRARRGSILLAEESQGRVTAQVFRGEHAGVAGTVTALQRDSVSHRVFYGRSPLLVTDAERELPVPRERQFPYASRSFLSVPLREDGRSLGVLHLTDRAESSFTADDLAFLERLGVQTSAAIARLGLEQEVRALRVMSETDPLTGVHNRRFLEECLAVELERSRRFGNPLAAVMIDIDDFKPYNDLMGHGCGDLILRELVAGIKRQVRSIDILSRYGGDEFLLLLPGTDLAGALGTAEKIRAEVERTRFPFEATGSRRRVTVSCGVSSFPALARTAQELLGLADGALLEAKKAGKNRVAGAPR